jgi:CelD/BcsL family acetyltransferase involved in cellulose biosynthesis
MLAQPVTFFENIWKAFAPHDGIVVGFASHEGEAIAASLYLIWNGTMYYKFGASIAERLPVRPNELLAWESLRLARQRGCKAYDWGVSDLDQPGLVAYKRKFASVEQTVTVLRHIPTGYTDFHGADVARVFAELTALMTRDDVPDEVTQHAGEVLYRYFC